MTQSFELKRHHRELYIIIYARRDGAFYNYGARVAPSKLAKPDLEPPPLAALPLLHMGLASPPPNWQSQIWSLPLSRPCRYYIKDLKFESQVLTHFYQFISCASPTYLPVRFRTVLKNRRNCTKNLRFLTTFIYRFF